MNTHTIRWNGDKTHRIVTFTKTFEKELIKAHPQAICVFISSLLGYLKQTTGRKHALDYKQEKRISEHLTQDLVSSESGWVDKVQKTPNQRLADNWIQNGVRLLDATIPDALSCLDYIYSRLLPISD